MSNSETIPISIDLQKCSACELCAFMCPVCAIHMVYTGEREYAQLMSKSDCIECYDCIEICESQAIYSV